MTKEQVKHINPAVQKEDKKLTTSKVKPKFKAFEVASANIKLERISPRKARLVADLIRYKDLADAINTLKNVNKKSAPIFLKLLNSAVANGVNNNGMNADKLFIKQVLVNEGPTLKRFQPRARGRAFSILKRTSKIMIEVAEKRS